MVMMGDGPVGISLHNSSQLLFRSGRVKQTSDGNVVVNIGMLLRVGLDRRVRISLETRVFSDKSSVSGVSGV